MGREQGTYDISEELEIRKDEETVKAAASRQVRLSADGVIFQDEYFDEPTEAEMAAQKLYLNRVMDKLLGGYK